MACDLSKTIVHGYLDGELDAVRAAEFESHLVSCSECSSALQAQENLRSSLQQANLYERAPESLRRGISTQLGAAMPNAVVPIHGSARSRFLPWLAATALLLLSITLGGALLHFLRAGPDQYALASEVVDAHMRSLQPGHLADVVSTDQHTVKPWFAGRIDFAPPVRDFASDGFPLQGGRIDIIDGRSAAVLLYGRRKHIVSVFIWPVEEADEKPRVSSKAGYNWVAWSKGGVEMFVVSDANSNDLETLRQLLEQ